MKLALNPTAICWALARGSNGVLLSFEYMHYRRPVRYETYQCIDVSSAFFLDRIVSDARARVRFSRPGTTKANTPNRPEIEPGLSINRLAAPARRAQGRGLRLPSAARLRSSDAPCARRKLPPRA